MIDFNRVFNPTPQQYKKYLKTYLKVHEQLAKDKKCSTCVHCFDVPGYHPGFVIGGEIDCDLGKVPIISCEMYEKDFTTYDNIKKELKKLNGN